MLDRPGKGAGKIARAAGIDNSGNAAAVDAANSNTGSSTMTISNSSVSGNSANEEVGGIRNADTVPSNKAGLTNNSACM